MSATSYQANSSWVRAWIRQRPDSSIDEIARAANNAGYGLPRGLITDLRHEVKRELERQDREFAGEAHKAAAFNPPKLIVTPPPAAALPPPKQVAQPQQPAAAPTESPEWIKRKKWISDQAERDPGMTTAVLMRLYVQTWPPAKNYLPKGDNIVRRYIADTLDTARALMGAKVRRESHKEAAPAPASAPAAATDAPSQQGSSFEFTVRAAARALLSAMPGNRIKSLTLTVADTGEVDWNVVEAPLGGKIKL